MMFIKKHIKKHHCLCKHTPLYLDFIDQKSDEIGLFTSEELEENTMIGVYVGEFSYTGSKKDSGLKYHDAEFDVGCRIMKTKHDRAAKDGEDVGD